MKKQLFIAIFACVIFSQNYAQIAPKSTNETTKIYFGSGKSELTVAQKQQLSSITQLAVTQSEGIFEIQGSSNSTGSADKNLLLAQQRANATKRHLIQQGINETQIRIIPAVVMPSKDEKERNVVINFYHSNNDNKAKISINDNNNIGTKTNIDINNYFANYNAHEQKALQSIQNFTDYWAAEMTEVKTIDATTNNIIYGKKGALIHIPANALVNSKGEIAQGEITLTLREAHTYADMILQNWTTMAQGKQLETGGMIAIFAKNKAGEDLQVASGQKLSVSLPSENARVSGMELFVGKIDSNTTAVDWHATNQPVQNNTNNVFVSSFENSSGNARGSFGNISNWNDSTLIKARELSRNCQIFTTAYTHTVDKPKPNKLTIPTPPVLTQVEELPKKQSKIDFGKANPQESSENKANYNERLQKAYAKYSDKYNQQRAAHLKIIAQNKAKLAQYNKALREYNNEVARFERENAKYNKYIADLRLRLHLVGTWAEHFSLNSYVAQVTQADNELNQLAIAEYTTEKTRYIRSQYAIFVAQNQTIQPFWQAAQSVLAKVVFSDEAQAKFKKLSTEINLIHTRTTAIQAQISQSHKNRKIIKDNSRAAILKEAQKLNAKQDWTEKDCALAKKLFAKVKSRPIFMTLQREIVRYTDFLAKNDSILTDAFAKQSLLDNEYKILMQKKVEFGLFSPGEIAERYNNIMSISSLGYINCDRFLRDDSPKACIEILVDTEMYNRHNTQFHIVFENIRSVMSTYQMTGKFQTDIIPLNRIVKIIGVSVRGNTAEIFIAKGRVRDFIKNKIRPIFEPKTLEEVMDIIKNV